MGQPRKIGLPSPLRAFGEGLGMPCTYPLTLQLRDAWERDTGVPWC
jgi:hypothetical protein